MRRGSLYTRMARVTAALLVGQGVAVFAAAGTLRYAQGWVYWWLQAVSMTATNLYLIRKHPALMERRLAVEEVGETEPVQRRVIMLLRVVMLAMLVAAGLDHRYGWTAVPTAVFVAGCVLFCAGAAVVFRVFTANAYTSSVIEVAAEQTVVVTGPYRFVRHPMYAGVLLMGLATPLVLGSYLAELFIVPAFGLLVVRILAEERFLAERLGGYTEYLKATRARLIPGVW